VGSYHLVHEGREVGLHVCKRSGLHRLES
jgi:hypothetical protein